MKPYTIIGPGAIGCYLAHALAGADHDVGLIDHRRDRAERLTREGIVLEEDGKALRRMIPVTCNFDGQTGPILICVKAPALSGLLQCRHQQLNEAPAILIIQNGGQWLDEVTALDNACIGGAAAYFGITGISPGRIRFAGTGPVLAGPLMPGAEGPFRGICEDLSKAGLNMVYTDDLRREMWKKILVNAAINPLSVKYTCPNGDLLDGGERERAMEQIVNEGLAAAAAEGYPFDQAEVMAAVKETCRKTAANISSMLADAREMKPIELDAITGYILRKGRRAGIEMPFNQEVFDSLSVLMLEKVSSGPKSDSSERGA